MSTRFNIFNLLFSDSTSKYILNSPLTSSNSAFTIENLEVNEIVANGYLQPSPYNQTSFVVNNLNIDEGVNNIDINTNNGGGEPITITLYTPNTWAPPDFADPTLFFYESSNQPFIESLVPPPYSFNTSARFQSIICELFNGISIPDDKNSCIGNIFNVDFSTAASFYVLYPLGDNKEYKRGDPPAPRIELKQLNEIRECTSTNPVKPIIGIGTRDFTQSYLGLGDTPPQFKLTITYAL
jgi:hypothetical protein